MNRRTFLTTTLAATGLTGLTGCTSVGGDSGDNKAGGQPTKTVSKKMADGKQLAYGETLELPQVALTIEAPRTTRQYTWTEGEQTQQAEAGEGKQWIVVPTRTKNTTNQPVRLPLTMNFKGIVGERVFHPGRNKSVATKYVGGKADGGETREGEMMFLTPTDVTAESFRVFYEEKRTSGTHKAWWQHSTNEE